MPYQDIDTDETTVVERKRLPSAPVRWLRRIFIDDWGVKLLALGITFVLWMAVTDLNKPRTMRIAAQLTFELPNNLDISNDPPRTVEVELTGSRERLNNMKLLDLIATVDISDNQAGERLIRLTGDRVQMDLPAGVRIESIRPTTVPVRLEPTIERQIPVEVKLEGQPAPGFEIGRSVAQPGVITVRGPASLVERLRQAPTEPISVEGKNANFTAIGAVIQISDYKIEVLNPTVDVVIEIAAKQNPAAPPISSERHVGGSVFVAMSKALSSNLNLLPTQSGNPAAQ